MQIITNHINNCKYFYSYLSASIGLRFDALTDGRSPKMIPISIENTTDTTIAGILMATGTDATLLIK